MQTLPCACSGDILAVEQGEENRHPRRGDLVCISCSLAAIFLPPCPPSAPRASLAPRASFADQAALETTTIRLFRYPTICVAPWFGSARLSCVRKGLPTSTTCQYGVSSALFSVARSISRLLLAVPGSPQLDAASRSRRWQVCIPKASSCFAHDPISPSTTSRADGRHPQSPGPERANTGMLPVIAAAIGPDPARTSIRYRGTGDSPWSVLAERKVDAFLGPSRAPGVAGPGRSAASSLDHGHGQAVKSPVFLLHGSGNAEFVRASDFTKRSFGPYSDPDFCAAEPQQAARHLINPGSLGAMTTPCRR